jgi:hypothetical protein
MWLLNELLGVFFSTPPISLMFDDFELYVKYSGLLEENASN